MGLTALTKWYLLYTASRTPDGSGGVTEAPGVPTPVRGRVWPVRGDTPTPGVQYGWRGVFALPSASVGIGVGDYVQSLDDRDATGDYLRVRSVLPAGRPYTVICDLEEPVSMSQRVP